eukprot:m.120417 g.120417  ORF g.120417 m.120417 type:complete len:462 (-) comp11053_c2_seq1:262-1647(-)
MGLWPAATLGDIDDAFAFTTPKSVRIRDYRLGVLNYGLQFIIFLYIIVYAIFINQGYNEFEPIFPGAVAVSARRDTSADTANGNYDYCCYSAALGGTQNDWSANTVCSGVVTATDVNFQSTTDGAFPCLYWPDDHAVFQVGLDTSIALATRVGISTVTRCSLDAYYESCGASSSSTDETMFYIAGIEHFTLRITHGVAGQAVDVSGQNVGADRIKGRLLNRNGNAITVATSDDAGNPGTEFTAQYGDQMTVSEILSAASIDLDARRSDPSNSSRTSTIRWDGINVVMYIEYGLKPLTKSLSYDYKPRILSDLEYKVEELVSDENSTSQVVYNRHAIRLLLVQTGRLGQFSFQALLITLVSALGLLAVSATIVNLIMTKLLPMAPFYKFSKVEVTEDFSVIRDAAKQEDFDELKSLVNEVNKGKGGRSEVLKRIDKAAAQTPERIASSPLHDPEYKTEVSAI